MDLDGGIRLQIAETGEVLRSWDEPLARSRILAADPSGRRLASVRGDSAIILDLDGRAEPAVLAGHDGPVWTWRGIRAGRGWPRPATTGHSGSATCGPAGRSDRSRSPRATARLLAYSGDGRRLASVSGRPVVGLWEPERGDRSAHCRPGTAARSTRSPGALGASRLAAAMADGTIAILEPETGRTGPAMVGHGGPASGSRGAPTRGGSPRPGQDGTVRIWDVETLQEVLVLRGHAGPVWCVAWGPDGRRLASAGADQGLRVGAHRDGRRAESCASMIKVSPPPPRPRRRDPRRPCRGRRRGGPIPSRESPPWHRRGRPSARR